MLTRYKSTLSKKKPISDLSFCCPLRPPHQVLKAYQHQPMDCSLIAICICICDGSMQMYVAVTQGGSWYAIWTRCGGPRSHITCVLQVAGASHLWEGVIRNPPKFFSSRNMKKKLLWYICKSLHTPPIKCCPILPYSLVQWHLSALITTSVEK